MKVSGNSESSLKNVNTCRKINKSREKFRQSTEFSAEKDKTMANQSKLQVEEGSDQTKKKVVYKKRCISPSCTYFAPDGLFGFPKKDGKKDFMRQKWLTALGLNEEELGKGSFICYVSTCIA